MKKISEILIGIIVLAIIFTAIYFIFKLIAPILPYIAFLIGVITGLFFLICVYIFFFDKSPGVYVLSYFAGVTKIIFVISGIIAGATLAYSVPIIF